MRTIVINIIVFAVVGIVMWAIGYFTNNPVIAISGNIVGCFSFCWSIPLILVLAGIGARFIR